MSGAWALISCWDAAWCAICLSWKKEMPRVATDYLSNFSIEKHMAPADSTAWAECSLSPLTLLSAGKCPRLSVSRLKKKKQTSVLVFLSVTVKIFLFEDLSGGCCLTHRSSFWSESELNECMFNLIIDSAAGLTTKPRGADNSSINLFSLATAPPVCVKIVFHLIRTQYSSCISITEVRESALLILRCWPPPWVSLWPVTTLGTDQIVSHKLVGHSKNNSASSSHSFTTFIVDRANPKN